MGYLPVEIQSSILSYVPNESVLECKVVSKTWNSLLSHRKTAKSGLLVYGDNCDELRFGYYDEILSLTRVQEPDFFYDEIPRHRLQNRSYLGKKKYRDDNQCLYKKLTAIKVRLSCVYVYRTSNLIGSCNGLVCLFVPDDRAPIFHIFNPFTGECFDLPTTYNRDDYMVMGFGYNASSSNYKVVRIQYPDGIQIKDQNKGLVQIYTLGGDSSGWRNIGEIGIILESNGILWNGSIYWMALDINQESDEWKIAAFDLADEEFRYLPTPALRNTICNWPRLTLLDGCLSIFDTDVFFGCTYIWSYKKKQNDDFAVEEGYNSSWDWILEFTIPFFPRHVDDDDYFDDDIPRHDRYEPIFLTANNEVFLWYKTRMWGGGYGEPILCRYDPKTDSLIKVMHWGHTDVNAVPHVNSFISLKDMGVDSKTIEFEAECGSSSLGSGCMATCAADCAENKRRKTSMFNH